MRRTKQKSTSEEMPFCSIEINMRLIECGVWFTPLKITEVTFSGPSGKSSP